MVMPRLRTAVDKSYLSVALYLHPDNKLFLRGKRDQVANAPGSASQRFSFVLVMIGLLIFAMAIYHGVRYWQLSNDGVTVRATFIESDWDQDADGSTYFITYAYSVDGELYEQHENVPKNIYDDTVAGAPIVITYSRSDPNTAIIGQPVPFALFIWGGFALIFNLVGWGLYVTARSQNALARRLSDGGILLPGEVERASVKIVDDEDSDSEYDKQLTLAVDYRFTSPMTKKAITARGSADRSDLLAVRNELGMEPGFYAPGDPIVVLYADDKHHVIL
ncbi:MAG: hypothetical protein CL607_02170 [Anaerolineaceae bacterium]|nr:hypothetical protein [Anaerolineaceae bacterium]